MTALLPHPETGELREVSKETLEDTVTRLQDHVRELQRTIASQSFRIGELTRDKQRDAEQHRLWPFAVKWHAHHNKVTGRRSRWKLDLFEMAEPFLNVYGYEVCCAASEGIAKDHYETKRKNGTTNHHTTWKVLLSSTDRFEEALNCCDLERLAQLKEEGLLPGEKRKPKGSAPVQRTLPIMGDQATSAS